MKISVQEADFDLGLEIAELRAQRANIGAIASFVGLVRDSNNGNTVTAMTLEHYPAMSAKALREILDQAMQRWQIVDATLIHRVGNLRLCDQIVLVAVAATHRHDAFLACEFIMDFLKTSAPFWKKEQTTQGMRWVEAREDDEAASRHWLGSGDAPSC
ncbi:MAG: molybdenum cofactor biosynthesis protein MoaE [Sulfuriferula sp.]